MATIRRVTIHRLRNVKPGCTFELHPGLNVLLGQNGTGKTTLLQWVADFLSGNLDSWSKEPYRVQVELGTAAEQGTAQIELTVENEVTERAAGSETQRRRAGAAAFSQQQVHAVVLTTDMTIKIGDDRYQIRERQPYLSFHLNEELLVESNIQEIAWGPKLNLASRVLSSALGRLLMHHLLEGETRRQTFVQKVEYCLTPILNDLASYRPPLDRFDESLGFLDRIVAGLEAQAQIFIPATSDEDAFSQKVPQELVELAVAKAREADEDVQTLKFTAEDLTGFLATAVRLFQHRSAAVHLTLLQKEVEGRYDIWHYGNLRFTFNRHDGSMIGHEALSYGQKRMLSFLYYLALNPRLIIVDELVNGLHHAWIEACIQEIGDRQGLLTSQNPLLLDYLTFESADEVRQRFILCRSERENGREQLVWRNPTQEEAESFFRAYQAGIQHVGEILVDKGLW